LDDGAALTTAGGSSQAALSQVSRATGIYQYSCWTDWGQHSILWRNRGG
jgi:hypothetical protein